MANFGSEEFGCGLLETSGNRRFDQLFEEELYIMEQFFSRSPLQAGYPTVDFFDECTPRNANAFSHSDGFILFGIHLAERLIREGGGSDLPVGAVLAHEYGHQLQFRHGWMPAYQSTARDTELEADAFSGYYAGHVKTWTGDRILSWFDALYNAGDFNFNDPNHHGTPAQRLAAAAIGLDTACLETTGEGFWRDKLHDTFTTRIREEAISGRFQARCLR